MDEEISIENANFHEFKMIGLNLMEESSQL
jgi:hypothetical protein